MKLAQVAFLSVLGLALSAPLMAQQGGGPGKGPGPGMGQGGGMGPGMGMGPRFNFDKDNTPGWALMSAEERTAHHGSMMAAKTYEECKAAQEAHHAAMAVRAKEKGVTLPTPRYNGCDRMKAAGIFK
ncbi:MAG: hypothetical protein K9J80_01880 [Sulfuritalea sp.]|nr:hypothetical protein [Sulfuritalea sp.]